MENYPSVQRSWHARRDGWREIKKEHSWAMTYWFDLYVSHAHIDQTNHECHSWLRGPSISLSPISSCCFLPLRHTSLKTVETRVATIGMVSGSNTKGQNGHDPMCFCYLFARDASEKGLEFLACKRSSPWWSDVIWKCNRPDCYGMVEFPIPAI